MRTELMPKQIDSFREQGFLMVSDFLDSLELAELSAAMDEAVVAWTAITVVDSSGG
jgi:hypothetical protein